MEEQVQMGDDELVARIKANREGLSAASLEQVLKVVKEGSADLAGGQVRMEVVEVEEAILQARRRQGWGPLCVSTTSPTLPHCLPVYKC